MTGKHDLAIREILELLSGAADHEKITFSDIYTNLVRQDPNYSSADITQAVSKLFKDGFIHYKNDSAKTIELTELGRAKMEK